MHAFWYAAKEITSDRIVLAQTTREPSLLSNNLLIQNQTKKHKDYTPERPIKGTKLCQARLRKGGGGALDGE